MGNPYVNQLTWRVGQCDNSDPDLVTWYDSCGNTPDVENQTDFTLRILIENSGNKNVTQNWRLRYNTSDSFSGSTQVQTSGGDVNCSNPTNPSAAPDTEICTGVRSVANFGGGTLIKNASESAKFDVVDDYAYEFVFTLQAGSGITGTYYFFISNPDDSAIDYYTLSAKVNFIAGAVNQTIPVNALSLSLVAQTALNLLSPNIALNKQDLTLSVQAASAAIGISFLANKQNITLTPQSLQTLFDSTIFTGSQLLNLATQSAQINYDCLFGVNKQNLLLSNQPANYIVGITLLLNAQSLSLSQNISQVNISEIVAAALQSLSFAIKNVTVETAGNVLIDVQNQSLNLAPQSVTLIFDYLQAVNKQDITLTINGVDISTGANILFSANQQILSLAQKNLTLDIVTNILLQAGLQTLNLQSFESVLALDQKVMANVQSLVLALLNPQIKVRMAEGKVSVIIEAIKPTMDMSASAPSIGTQAKHPTIKIEGE